MMTTQEWIRKADANKANGKLICQGIKCIQCPLYDFKRQGCVGAREEYYHTHSIQERLKLI